MKNKTYLINTYGCQMNAHDSEKIAWLFEQKGYRPAKNEEEADIILFNTCAIRQTAENKVFGKLGSLKPLKKKYPNKIIAVSGCMMQTEVSRDKILKSHEHVSLIFGTHNLWKLPLFLEELEGDGQRVIDVVDQYNTEDEKVKSLNEYTFKAYVNIMYGCDNFCTYCIVPYTRGREHSRQPEYIIKEIEELVNRGCKEVTLLGQNVNSYGKTLENPISFTALLEKINQIEGLERIRFMTSHPKDISLELINSFNTLEKLCPVLHLPLQSGSTKVLKEMNRHYTAADYLNIVNNLKKIAPQVVLSTDIMIGFPGETEEDFQETLNLVEEVEFDSSFTFIYSPRKGTPAAEREDQVPEEIAKNRFNRLLDVLYKISLKTNKNLIGTTHTVLVEEVSRTNDHLLTGKTATGKLVHFKGNKNLIGHFTNVKITKANTFALEGVQVKDDNCEY